MQKTASTPHGGSIFCDRLLPPLVWSRLCRNAPALYCWDHHQVDPRGDYADLSGIGSELLLNTKSVGVKRASKLA